MGRLGAANDANRAHCAHKSNRRALNVAVRHSMLNHRQDGCIRRDERCGPGMCTQGSIWRRRLACALWRTQGEDVRAFLLSAFSLSQVGWVKVQPGSALAIPRCFGNPGSRHPAQTCRASALGASPAVTTWSVRCGMACVALAALLSDQMCP